MPRYDAFISYSHAAAGFAPLLHRALQRYAKPWWKRRAVRVFRDQTNLTLAPDLFGAIRETLDDSRHLILLASPEAAHSVWVDREVGHWLAAQGPERVLILLLDGEIAWSEAAADFDPDRTTALPPALHGAFAAEPLWLDLRWTGGGPVSRRDPRLLDAVARLSAVLRGVSLDEIAGEDLRQHKRTRRVRRWRRSCWSPASPPPAGGGPRPSSGAPRPCRRRAARHSR